MPVTPPRPHYTVEDTDDSLRFYIPPLKRWYILLFLAIWLIFWIGIGSPFAFGVFPILLTQRVDGFFIIWPIAWLLGIIYAVYILLWALTGVEAVEVSSHGITTRRQIFRLSRSQEYDGEHIRCLRAAPSVYNGIFASGRGFDFMGLSGGPIAFDYGAKTVRFGASLNEAEANIIVESITKRFQRYQCQ